MIRDSLYFNYNAESSELYNILNINLDSGMLEEHFLPTRTIQEIKSLGNKFYFQGFEYEPITIPITFAYDQVFDDDMVRNTIQWLFKDYYCPLYFSENPTKIFYAVVTDDIKQFTNGMQEGYVTLNFRCNTFHAYSPVYLSDVYDLDTNTSSGTIIDFTNNGDVSLYPEILLTKTIEDGNISIINITNGGEEFIFTNIDTDEELYINNEKEIITTSKVDTYRYDNFNDNYLECVTGINQLKILGKCQIQFRWQCILL